MQIEPKKVFIEVRAAAGGDEARIWANDLVRMYSRFATKKNWRVVPVDEGTISIVGEGVFNIFKNDLWTNFCSS